ncbi:MAG: hypothetical protein AAGA48_26820 [Myxococcota bacterium]
MRCRTVCVALLLPLFGNTAFAHDMGFGSQWRDLEFMEDGASPGSDKIVLVVDVLEVRAGRGKRLANSITGRITNGRERSGVLAEEQYRDLLRSVNEGKNLRAYRSTVVTAADRLGTTSWTPQGADGKAVVDLRFARDEGLWAGTVEFRALDADKALQGEYRAVANRFFLRGKSGSDWLLMVTLLDETPRDRRVDPWQQPSPSWSPEEALEPENWQ